MLGVGLDRWCEPLLLGVVYAGRGAAEGRYRVWYNFCVERLEEGLACAIGMTPLTMLSGELWVWGRPKDSVGGRSLNNVGRRREWVGNESDAGPPNKRNQLSCIIPDTTRLAQAHILVPFSLPDRPLTPTRFPQGHG